MRPSVIVVLSCLCYCCIAAARTAIACGPVRQDTSAAPELICHPVGEQEESCNSDVPFLSDKKLKDCFGDSVNNYVGETSLVEDGSRYELADLRNFTKTGTVGYCPQSPNSMPFGKCITPSGSIGSTKLNITHNFSPYNYLHYNLTIRVDSLNAYVEAYGLLLTRNGVTTCVCINASFTNEYSFILGYGEYTSVEVKVDTFPRTLTSAVVKTIVPPTDCADYERGIAFDEQTCGLPQYEKPRNVSLRCNSTHTNISWDMPYYREPGEVISTSHSEPDIDTYYLTVSTCDGQKNYFTIRNSTEITINTSMNFDFLLYGYSPCSGFYEYKRRNLHDVLGCSQPAGCTDVQDSEMPCCLASPLSVCPTPTPSASSIPGDEHLVVYILPSAGGMILTMIILIAVIAVCYRILRNKPTRVTYIYCPVAKKSPSPCAFSALIMYSPNTPELEKNAITQQLGPDLQGVESFLLTTRLPRQALIHWITEKYEKSDAVFCICNEEFREDWESDSAGTHCSDDAVVVRTLRKLFEGDIAPGAKMPKRYAVVLTKPRDEDVIPSILRGLPRFNMSDSRALAGFVGLKVESLV
jgi:hypothetical protein